MPYGYNGRILRVDLSTGGLETEEPPEQWYRTYWGGGCLASYYLLREQAPGTDPLGPDNLLVFACSVLTGAPLSGLSRYTVAARSPLTGAFGESEAGGFFGPELKFSGFDAVVIRGASPEPVYLWIKDGRAELRPAGRAWGMENGEALDAIRAELGEPGARAATIGPAGERRALLSNVMNELGHANGRCAMGAVMGSKNLKAVACRGQASSLRWADPAEVRRLVAWTARRYRTHMPNVNLRNVGTPGLVAGLNQAGILPTRNWRDNQFEGAERIGMPGYKDILVGPKSCYRCAVACKRRVDLGDGPWRVDPRYGGPEYETLAAFGSACGVDDLGAVAKANEICNRFGLDTIGAGAAVSFAMECFEEGVLSAADNEGRAVRFGDARSMVDLVEDMARNRGLGGLLAQGVDRAAAALGRGAEEFAFTIKGQEIPFHDGRGKGSVALGMAVSPTGADHIEAPHETPFQGEGASMLGPLGILESQEPSGLGPAKVRYFKAAQLSWAMNNTIGLCNFTAAPLFGLSYAKLVEVVGAVTGWESSLYELFQAAERSITMARLFNNREGFGPDDDRLFRRMHEPMASGPGKGNRVDPLELARAVRLYYQAMGWDDQGRPLEGKLAELGLDWAATC